MRDSRYDVLFEPVAIGPRMARNRFFQIPRCNGWGYRDPTAQAEMRAAKAEGGWSVVSTEEVEIHPSTNTTPNVERGYGTTITFRPSPASPNGSTISGRWPRSSCAATG